MKTYQWIGLVCGGLCVAANAQTMIESFEYASDDELLAAWTPSGGVTISLSDSVATTATGKKSMKAEFNFPSTAWATETIRGVDLTAPISIGDSQYVSFRMRGDAAFSVANYQHLFLYAYDADGNFGRWGTTVPLTADWQVMNFKATPMEQPWDSPALPDLNAITRFAFFQYGSSETPIDPYTATIYIDEVTVRDTPLIEFPAPSAARELIDDFEGYKDDAALRAFYTYENSPATTATVVSLAGSAAQGANALKLAIDFAPGQWPWGSAWSSTVSPFSIPTNAVVTFKFKGDPSFNSVIDSGTIFRLRFTDKAGGHIDYWSSTNLVVTTDWTTVTATLADFGDHSTVDIGNIVKWQLLVEAWQGTADSVAKSGTFYVDDIRVTVPSTKPKLTMVNKNGSLSLIMDNLTTGAAYDLHTCTEFSKWTTVTTLNPTTTSMTYPITPTAGSICAFYQLLQK